MLFNKKNNWFSDYNLFNYELVVGNSIPNFCLTIDNPDSGVVNNNDNDDNNDDNNDNNDNKNEVVSKSAFEKLQRESIKRKNAIKAKEAEIAKLKANSLSEKEREDYYKYLDDLKAKKVDDKKKKGEYEALILEQKSEFEKQLAASNLEKKNLQFELANTQVVNKLATLLPGMVHEKAPINDIIMLVRNHFVYDPDDKKVVVVNPEDPDGDRPLGANGEDQTPIEFIENWLKTKPLYAPSEKDSGSGGGNKKGSGQKGRYSIKDIENMSQEEYNQNKTKIHAQL